MIFEYLTVFEMIADIFHIGKYSYVLYYTDFPYIKRKSSDWIDKIFNSLRI